MRAMIATRYAAVPALSIVLLLVVACGGRSELVETISSCPDPDSAVPYPGSLMLGPGAYETLTVTLRNQCAQTIWPAWKRTGGLDASVPDPSLWAPILPEESREVTIYYLGPLEIALWGRTRCSFDEQGRGACETGDCGGFTCFHGETPGDATTYDFFKRAFLGAYNVPLRKRAPGCDALECRFDLDGCADASRVAGACGVAACTNVCPSASGCCDMFADVCLLGGEVDFTFCP